MHDINYLFPNKFIINLKQAHERLVLAKSEFNRVGIYNVERFEAVNGSELSVNNLFLRKGEVGALMSHVALIRLAKEKGYRNILIFEDDVYFVSNFKDIFHGYWQEMYADWDMIYFGAEDVLTPLTLNSKVKRLVKSWCIHAYVIRDTMYDTILEITKPMQHTIDIYYTFLMPHYKCYGFLPNLAGQRPGHSYINNAFIDRQII